MPETLLSTPREDGFRLPGEFELHAGTWMLWPERTDNWRLGAKPAQRAFAAAASTIAQFEPVSVGVSAAQFRNARNMLPAQVRVVELASNDAWMRDCGPTFVVNSAGEVRGVDWDFNAWGGLEGGLYFPWDLDAQVAQKVLEIERMDRYQAPLVLEGGSIHVDGEGTCLTTRECLLNPNRNPKLNLQEIEAYLCQYLNVREIIWLDEGVYADETSGHVDNLCCFVRPGVVALTWTDDRSDPQYLHSQAAYEVLSQAVDGCGRRIQVHKVHQPGPLYISETEAQAVDEVEGSKPRRAGDRLAGSYINFYITNGGVIIPQFDDQHDRSALAVLQALFPERKVIGLPAREILLGGGNIHCITQQQPFGHRIHPI
jgi:agmatine deiminase